MPQQVRTALAQYWPPLPAPLNLSKYTLNLSTYTHSKLAIQLPAVFFICHFMLASFDQTHPGRVVKQAQHSTCMCLIGYHKLVWLCLSMLTSLLQILMLLSIKGLSEQLH